MEQLNEWIAFLLVSGFIFAYTMFRKLEQISEQLASRAQIEYLKLQLDRIYETTITIHEIISESKKKQ